MNTKKNTIILFALLFYAIFAFSQEVNLVFNRWGLSFSCQNNDVFREWTISQNSNAKKGMQSQMAPFDIDLQELIVMTTIKDNATILITKSSYRNGVTIDSLYKEREKTYKDLMTSGVVTKLFKLEKAIVDEHQALIEDVKRSDGMRGISVKVLSSNTVYEISLIMTKSVVFSTYETIFIEIIKSIKINS